ncbi:MAG: hypothetical protein IJR46_05245 [Neisseriaceae bacterium]|nr:hypothetical protein [Neisseriaceae bacterium]
MERLPRLRLAMTVWFRGFRQPEIFISTRHYEDRNAVCGNPLNVSVTQNKEFQFK